MGISGDMERHELKHTGERPFSCDQCSETFTRLQYLREHQNTHQGRRPYKCVFCGLSFHDFASCRHHVSKHKVTEEKQPAQQIHVEVTPDVSGFSCVCGWVGACAYMFCVHVHVYVWVHTCVNRHIYMYRCMGVGVGVDASNDRATWNSFFNCLHQMFHCVLFVHLSGVKRQLWTDENGKKSEAIRQWIWTDWNKSMDLDCIKQHWNQCSAGTFCYYTQGFFVWIL